MRFLKNKLIAKRESKEFETEVVGSFGKDRREKQITKTVYESRWEWKKSKKKKKVVKRRDGSGEKWRKRLEKSNKTVSK